jgi:potassium efflux system protein
MRGVRAAARRLRRLTGSAGLIAVLIVVPVVIFMATLPATAPAARAQNADATPPADAAPAAQAPLSPPQSPVAPDHLRPLSDWGVTLDRIELLLAEPSVSDRTLADARREITALEASIESHIRKLRPRLAIARSQAERMGAPPAPAQAPESAAIAQQRSALADNLAQLTSAMNASEAAFLRAENLAEQIREVRRRDFQDRVLQRAPSPLSPDLWRQVAEDIPAGVGRLDVLAAEWRGAPGRERFLTAVLGALALTTLLSLLAWRGILRYRHWRQPEAPSEWRRVSSAGWVIALRALPSLAGASLVMLAVRHGGLLPGRLERLVETTLFAIMVVVAVHAVSKTVLAVNRSIWRLLPLADKAAWQLYRRIMALALVFGGDRIAAALGEAADMPFSLSLAQSSISSVAYAALIISILLIRTPAEGGKAGDSQTESSKAGGGKIGRFYVRLPLWLVAVTILAAAALGYVALARFIAGQLIVISTILTIAYLFIVWASAFGQSLSDDSTPAGRWAGERLMREPRRREQVALPLTLLLQTGILVAAIPFVLLQWGFDWQDIREFFRAALFGFQLGPARISILTVIGAVLLFVSGYIGARVFQGWLDHQVLEPAGVEDSARHSIRTSIFYLGVALAALVAVSYAGLDISNIAIVAGALSVGIGFGLQSIVNNFVSGLILLAERPVKVGDWVIVGEDEGLVRRISVRSTEIETFDRSNVIVPNSMLITQKVKNWTLHNNTGRYRIKANVHFDSDPEQVRDIMLAAAKAHSGVLSAPAPFVYFEDFGEHALSFTLFVYLANVSQSHAVRTDLRAAILKGFRAAGIEMPYPQAGIHLRDLDWVKRAIAERLAKREEKPMTSHRFEAESDLAKDEGENGEGEDKADGEGNGSGS